MTELTNDQIIKGFSDLLLKEKDDEGRRRLLAKARMLAMREVTDDELAAPITTLGTYLSEPIEVPPTLVDPFIVVRGGMTCTIGRAGKGKTVMNLNRILKWAAGKPMFDGWTDSEGSPLLCPEKPLKTLVIENEGAAGLFHRQIGIMLHADDFMSEEDRELAKQNVLIWDKGGYSGLKLDDPQKVALVRQGCEEWQPDIVFVEPFRGLWNGEENSATDMAIVVDAMMEIATDYNCGVMLAHHERKSGAGEDGEKMSAGRGSTVLEGAVTVMENFESVKGGEFRELSWSKSRHGKAPNPVRMEWVPDSWWYKWCPTSNIDESIIAALADSPEPMTIKGLMDDLQEKEYKLRQRLTHLSKENKIKKIKSESTGMGTTGVRYRLPSDDNTGFGGLAI